MNKLLFVSVLLNALDAFATNISVTLDFNEFGVTVIDNGMMILYRFVYLCLPFLYALQVEESTRKT
jgi:hypothetical protein